MWYFYGFIVLEYFVVPWKYGSVVQYDGMMV